MKLELAPPCAAREFIPLRTNALIEIGMPGTCCVDRFDRQPLAALVRSGRGYITRAAVRCTHHVLL
jgi:hypothetical protein